MIATIEDKCLALEDESIIKINKCLVIYPESEDEAVLLTKWKRNIRINSYTLSNVLSNVRFLIEKEINDETEIFNWAKIE